MTRDEMNVWLQRIWMEKTKTVLFVTHDISEAVFLSDRVMVLSSRPGTIKEIIKVDLPRPRKLETTEKIEFMQYITRIRKLMHEEGFY
jgi:NitT/TauT family transport system ATP-binding protein